MSSGIEFEEDKFSYGKPTTQSSAGVPNFNRPIPSNIPGMAVWLMKHGIKSDNVAQAVLIGFIVFNVVVTFIVIKFFVL